LDISNLTQEKIDEKLLRKVASGVIDFLGGEKLEQISLVIVGEEKIREINKKYRRKDAVTDVLSFEKLNEIFICLPQAKKQAGLLKTSLNFELTRLLVHGIVHLKGYDHERSKKEADEMEGIERQIVKDLKL
jgi:probable rRNA maturation factor